MSILKKAINSIAAKAGYARTGGNLESPAFKDIKEAEFHQLHALCKPFTMTSVERMYALYSAVKYVLDHNIAGSFVECGVWRGGSSLLIAKMLANRNITDRQLYLYDTYEGMPPPTENDKDINGTGAGTLLQQEDRNKATSVWCLAGLDDVKANMELAGYAATNIIYVEGKVEDTIPAQTAKGEIALLRLDTDWYESTRHELIHLYPQLAQNGVLIIDDYGHWEGCRKAVDEYFAENSVRMLLQRVDYTCRAGIKNSL